MEQKVKDEVKKKGKKLFFIQYNVEQSYMQVSLFSFNMGERSPCINHFRNNNFFQSKQKEVEQEEKEENYN